jgi:RNA polymerase sigma-70 factor (ECF subfamily)
MRSQPGSGVQGDARAADPDRTNLSAGWTVFSDSEQDAQSVARCLGGELEAFGDLIERYQRVLFNVALRLLGNPEDARDVSHDALLKAFEKLSSYDPSHKFFSWIYRITVNESLNRLSRRREIQPLDPNLRAADDPLAAVVARETSDSVQQALLRLTPEQREVVVLRHFLEMSYAEMSATLLIPEKTVKSRLYEARQRLATLLEGLGEAP